MESSNDDRVDREVVDAIGALGNERRLEILFALADREWELRRDGHAMSFTELYDEVDLDSTSQFSYHLSRLVGRFVAETPEGYRLTYAGGKIVRAVRSGLYESTPEFESVDVSGTCPSCRSASLVADSHDERFVVRCAACESPLLVDAFPRSQARGRSPSEIAESFGHRIWSASVLVRGGVCPECFGVVETTVEPAELEGRSLYKLVSACSACRMVVNFPIEVAVAFHPVAVEFFWRHGRSILETPLWELFGAFVSEEWTTDVASVSPLDARFEISIDDETIAFAMDESLTVKTIDADSAPRTDADD